MDCIPLKYIIQNKNLIKQMKDAFEKDLKKYNDNYAQFFSFEKYTLSDCIYCVQDMYDIKYSCLNEGKVDHIPQQIDFMNTEKLICVPIDDFGKEASIKRKLKAILEEDDMYMQDALSVSWLSTKKIYQIDADFAKELLETTEIKMYSEIVQYIPFKTFYIDLTTVEYFKNTLGVFVYIVFKYNQEHKLYYELFMNELSEFSEEELSEGSKEEIEYKKNHYKTNFHHTWSSIDDVKTDEHGNQYIVRNNNVNDYVVHDKGKVSYFDENDRYGLELGTFVLNFITYLVSQKPDIEETELSKKTYKPFTEPSFKFNQVQTFNTGVRYGKKIRFVKKLKNIIINEDSNERNYKQSSAKRPHIRAAHWTHVWCGKKEEQHLEIRWIEPCYINGNYKTIDSVINELTNKSSHMFSGEQIIHEYLDAININHKMQYYVPKISSRYDCCIEYDNKKMFIEYDGEQHFRPIEYFGGEEKYKKQIESDRKKDKWCEENNYPLLRIRYIDKPEIVSQINDFLKKPEKYIKKHSKHGDDYYNNLRGNSITALDGLVQL